MDRRPPASKAKAGGPQPAVRSGPALSNGAAILQDTDTSMWRNEGAQLGSAF